MNDSGERKAYHKNTSLACIFGGVHKPQRRRTYYKNVTTTVNQNPYCRLE
jgi:hypothetical protein